MWNEEKEISQGRSESKYNVRCTELTTNAQNIARLLGDAKCLWRGYKAPWFLRTFSCGEEA